MPPYAPDSLAFWTCIACTSALWLGVGVVIGIARGRLMQARSEHPATPRF